MTTTRKPTRRPATTAATRARREDDARRLDRLTKSLEAAQEDLSAIGGSVGTGVRDLRRDVAKLLRDARRDLIKMRRAVQRDLDRLQRDLTSAASSDGTRRPAHPTRKTRRRAVH
jgi:hypothetical protein